MVPTHIVFILVVLLVVASGLAATSIVMFGDTRRNAGQRAVAEKLAHITVVGALAIIAMLGSPS